jgi:polysaccharide export outer membrane protein
MRRRFTLRHFSIVPCCIFFLTGCGNGGGSGGNAAQQGPQEGRSAPINQWLAGQPIDAPAAVYRVASPDKLRIVAPGVKELDGQTAVIRSDGKISLNMVGELNVNNLTPAEISELLVQKLQKYYKSDSIDVSVQVAEFKSRVYYVMGQVLEPGIKAYTGTDTILKVIAEAKLNEQAWPQKVVIVRPNDDAAIKQRVTVDLKAMYESGKSRQNFLIEPGDVIYVPLSPLAETALTFKKVLFPILPATNLGMMLRGGI